MKALTLKAPWAFAVVALGKRVENRTWRPPVSLIGQRIAIHAGAGGTAKEKKAVSDIYARCKSSGSWLKYAQRVLHHERSAIVATAVISSVRHIDDISESERTPWHVGPWCWELTDVREVQPVAVKGRLGLWNVPAEVAAELEGKP